MDKNRLIKEITEQVEILSTVAIPREAEAHRFYVGLANNSGSKNTKELFIDLARQEIEHKKILAKLKEDLTLKLAKLKKK